jgi:hypothetical protein
MTNSFNPDGAPMDRPQVTWLFSMALTFGRKLKLANPFRRKKDGSSKRG